MHLLTFKPRPGGWSENQVPKPLDVQVFFCGPTTPDPIGGYPEVVGGQGGG